MPVRDPKELFVFMLSDVRMREERSKNIFTEMSKYAEDPDVKQSLEAWIFLKDKIINTLDHCFQLIGMQPVPVHTKLTETFLEDFQREFNEIQYPLGKALYIRAKWNEIMHLQIGEYTALVAMADYTGHYAVGALIESCLGEYMAFVERTRRHLRNIVRTELETKMRKAA